MNERVHASTVAIEQDGAWRAVMLTGRSGSGKSDLALRLIDRGARLVADDYTDIRAADGVAIASAPATISGLIEVRGLGIATVPSLPEAPVALIVALDGGVERMPDAPSPTRPVAGVAVPCIALAPFEASAAIKVEMALAMALAVAVAA